MQAQRGLLDAFLVSSCLFYPSDGNIEEQLLSSKAQELQNVLGLTLAHADSRCSSPDTCEFAKNKQQLLSPAAQGKLLLRDGPAE